MCLFYWLAVSKINDWLVFCYKQFRTANEILFKLKLLKFKKKSIQLNNVFKSTIAKFFWLIIIIANKHSFTNYYKFCIHIISIQLK